MDIILMNKIISFQNAIKIVRYVVVQKYDCLSCDEKGNFMKNQKIVWIVFSEINM